MNTTKIIGTAILVLSAGLAVIYPQYKAELVGLTTFLVGWLHIPQPRTETKKVTEL